ALEVGRGGEDHLEDLQRRLLVVAEAGRRVELDRVVGQRVLDVRHVVLVHRSLVVLVDLRLVLLTRWLRLRPPSPASRGAASSASPCPSGPTSRRSSRRRRGG